MGMKTRTRFATSLAAVLLVVGAARAQETQTIAPGMSEAEVNVVFGQPENTRSYGDFTFYFYDNGCQDLCGTADVIFFQGGQVVDAVLRAPWRDYAGESSSPKGISPRPTPGSGRLQTPAEVESVQVQPARVPTPLPVEPDTAKADTSVVRG